MGKIKLFITFILFVSVSLSGCKESQTYDSTFTSPPQDDLFRVLTAEIAATRNETQIAADYYLALANEHRNTSFAHRAMQLAIEGSDIDQAFAAAKLWSTLSPQDPELYFNVGVLALETKNIKLAAEAVEGALALRPQWVEAIALKTQIFLNIDKPQQALIYLSNELRKQPKNNLLRTVYADTLMHLNSFSKAETEFNILAKTTQFNGYAHLNLAKIAMEKNNTQSAIIHLKKVLEDPTQANFALYLLGAIAEDEHHYENAINWYSDIKDGPLFLNAQIRVGTLIATQKQPNEGIYYLDSIPTFNADEYRQVNLAKSNILISVNQPKEAFKILTEALKTIPTDKDLLLSHSSLALQLTHYADAERDLRLLLQDDPDNVDILNTLGNTLIEHGNNYIDANKYLSHGLAIAPNHSALLMNMGWLQYHLRNYDTAIEYLKRSWEVGPQAKTAALLSTVLWKSGDQSGAEKIWQEALKKYPNDPLLLDTIKQLKK